jgi:phosphotransferase system enzyme I (PtsI)
MASNPFFTPLFLGLGIQELSCAPRFIPLVKRVVRNCTIVEAYGLVQKIFELTSASAIADLLRSVYREQNAEES